MPMKTTLDSRPGPPGISPAAIAAAAATAWPMISAADRLQVRPLCPVAQNEQAGQQRGREVLPDGGRDVGHLRRVGDAGVEVPGELVGAERRLAELGDRR